MVVKHRALIGLTGGIGSGKSTVADAFAALGAGVVDTDQIAHRLTAPNGTAMPAILAEFGPSVADSTGAMDRSVMREIVFSDPLARKRLEAILHPMIGAESTRALEAVDGPYRIVVVPLLVEGRHWRSRVDRVLVVDCPRALQIERVIQRSGLALEQIEAILDAQATREERLAQADDVIDNSGLPAELPGQIQALHATYCQLRS
ncbi:MAG: dephospho-CoA kinase [Betaproteobacteria bacterium]|nr:dephospho-CoA kinase [Betaproteobacteria bacterium]NBY18563.1 dephospho-CoA kinase [Betaproteobacteria bacterium]